MKPIDLKAYARIELHPRETFLRFFIIQLLVAVSTLLVCPQFGMGPLGGGAGISGWVMKYGDFACGAFCGFIFYGFSTLISLTVMRREEVFWFKRNQLHILSLIFLLFFSLLMMSKSFFNTSLMHESFSYYSAWIMMGLLSMFASTKVTTQWRLNN